MQNITNVQNQVNNLIGANVKLSPETRAQKWQSFAAEIIGVRKGEKRPFEKGWSTWHGTPDYMARLDRADHNYGMLSRRLPGIDGDITKSGLAKIARDTALEILGPAPLRTRAGTSKFLLMYRTDELLRKRFFIFKDGEGNEHKVELLASGQQYVVAGVHPDGSDYVWNEQPSPWELSTITAEQWDNYCRALAERLQRAAGVTVVKDGLGGALVSTAIRRDADSLLAPEPEDALAAMMQWKERRGDAHNEHMPHDEFVQLCAAFHGAAGEDAEALYDEFCELLPGDRPTDGNTYKTFHSMEGGVNLGWSRLCQITGFIPPDTFDAPLTEDEQAVMDTSDPETVARREARAAMLDRYMYVASPDCFYDVETRAVQTATQFDRANTAVADAGSSGCKAAHNIFLNIKGHKQAATFTYQPGKPAITREERDGQEVDCANTWRPSSLKPRVGVDERAVKPWLDHVALLFPRKEDRDHVLNWLAYIFQNRGQKINHAMVLFSKQEGVGKDTMLEPLLLAIGKHNVAKIDQDVLREPFNEWNEKELVVVKEVMDLRRNDLNKIKGRLAATPSDTVRINRKNVPAYDVPNIQNWVFFTNHENALALDDNERRFWVCRCEPEVKKPEYFIDLYAWYENGGVEAVAGYLLARDISAFNPAAPPPMTEAKQAMIEHALPKAVRWLREQFREGGSLVSRTLVTVGDVMAVAGTAARDGLAISRSSHVPVALAAEGFTRGPRLRLRHGEDKQQLWTKGPPELLAQLPQDKLKDRYDAEVGKAAAAAATARFGGGSEW